MTLKEEKEGEKDKDKKIDLNEQDKQNDSENNNQPIIREKPNSILIEHSKSDQQSHSNQHLTIQEPLFSHDETSSLLPKPASNYKRRKSSSFSYTSEFNMNYRSINSISELSMSPEVGFEDFENEILTKSPQRRDMLPSPTPSQLEDIVIDPNSIPYDECEQPKNFIGLTDKEAYSQLIISVEELLMQYHKEEDLLEFTMTYLSRVESLILIGDTLLLVFVFIWGWFRGSIEDSQYQFRYNGVLVEIFILLLVLAWNGVMYYRESRLTTHETLDRARSILKVMEDNRARPMRPLKLPICPTFSIVNVYRDGILQQLPVNLTVDGDIIEIAFGMVAFCDMEYMGSSPERMKLKRGEIFQPKFFNYDPNIPLQQSTFKFLLMETRFASTLSDTLQQKRPRSMIDSQRSKIRKYFSLGFGFSSLFLCGIVNAIVYILVDIPANNWDHWAEVLVRIPGYALLAWLPLWIPSFWFIVRSYCNAHTLVLFEALQKSKEEFEDEEDIDEFDTEAPSPTKNIEISFSMVFEKWWWLMSQWNQVSLTRSTNLFESLGSITMLCALDKEETIATPFPEMEHILFVNSDKGVVKLDVNEDKSSKNAIRFEDQDWEKYITCLKPLGLNTMLCTKCGVIDHQHVTYKPANSHLNNLDLDLNDVLAPARQTCLCRLGLEVGFTPQSLASFSRKKDIVLMAPYHPTLTSPTQKKLDFEIPLALSTIYRESKSGNYQLLSSGHMDLILDHCADYWDGEGLCTFTNSIENKIYDFYENAIGNDLQCVAYSYRPINIKNDNELIFLNDEEAKSSIKIRISNEESENISSPSSTISKLSSEDEDEINDLLKRKRIFSKITIEEDEVDPTIAEQDPLKFYKNQTKGQIFLAMTTSAHQPKPDVCDVIEDLKLAGIRFVYFSPKDERRSKAFAERLGMETDWNTCIRLSPSSSEDDFDDHYIKARLPCGIETIRDHLENVDDIPLQVSLFAECSPEATVEMIKIFQEYGEVVCCIGNSLNHLNTPAFATADLGIAVEPLLHRRFASTQLFHSTVSLGSTLTSLPCALFFNKETSLFVLTQIIREARRLLNSVRQGGSFLLAVGMASSLLIIVNSILIQPPILSGYHILWLLWIVGPIITMPFLFTPHEPNTMTSMVGKNKEHIPGFMRFFMYGFMRMLGSILTWQFLFVVSFYNLRIIAGDMDDFLSRRDDWYAWTPNEQWALLHSQNLTLFFMVYHLCLISGTFMSRTLYFWEHPPYYNKQWLLGIFIAILIQTIYSLTFFIESPQPFTLIGTLNALPYWYYVMGFVSPILLLPLQEMVKYHDRDIYTRFQKRSKLEFNTKLGLHSPV
ncbi:hypothetical protein K502DRAFT_298739 [Neoconidiobolus thromboides FSU 785]|nr:hypothetical protein K502DRAFT_298739 [Neoconidiobolus thromboides FSU 785]